MTFEDKISQYLESLGISSWDWKYEISSCKADGLCSVKIKSLKGTIEVLLSSIYGDWETELREAFMCMILIYTGDDQVFIDRHKPFGGLDDDDE